VLDEARDEVRDVVGTVLDTEDEVGTTTPPGPATEVVKDPLSIYTPLK
jgi:hypothetical protein